MDTQRIARPAVRVQVPATGEKATPPESTFPPVSRALLDHLDRLYPERFPRLDESEREIWHAAGARSVVRLLRRHFELQQQTP
jgi:hypothetical protein